MSSLWTPGGEVPIDREQPQQQQQQPDPDEAELAEQMAQMRAQLLEAPAAQVVVQHLMSLYELAALHLSQSTPRLADARLAIDAVEAVLGGLQGRLGDAEEAIASALPQLKMAFVEASDRAKGSDAHD